MRSLTDTERRICRLLSDGKPHRRQDVLALLPDNLGPLSNAKKHVNNLNKKLEEVGRTVVAVYTNRGIQYQMFWIIDPELEQPDTSPIREI